MDLAHFTELVQGTKYNLADFVTAKFNIEQVLNKYLLVSAPGEASPIVKRSYLKLKVALVLFRLMAPRRRMACTHWDWN